jgi:hypothetical protein
LKITDPVRHRLDTRILDRVRRPERNGTNIVYIDPVHDVVAVVR